MKFYKKPVAIKAFMYEGYEQQNLDDGRLPEWARDALENGTLYFKDKELYIKTLEGDRHASKGDFIMQGVNGEIYPCKPDIVDKTCYISNNAKTHFKNNIRMISAVQTLRAIETDKGNKETAEVLRKIDDALHTANGYIKTYITD